MSTAHFGIKTTSKGPDYYRKTRSDGIVVILSKLQKTENISQYAKFLKRKPNLPAGPNVILPQICIYLLIEIFIKTLMVRFSLGKLLQLRTVH